MTERDLSTGHSFTRSIVTGNSDLCKILVEAAIDSALDEGLLRDIPIIGVVAGLAKAQRNFRDENFLRKITSFFEQIYAATPEERHQFYKKNFENDEASYRFGQSVLILIERADNMEKPKIIGRIMCAAVRDQIDLTKAMRLSAMVDRCYLEDLAHLQKFENGPQFPEFQTVVEALQSVGFLSTAGFDGGTFGTEEPTKAGTIYKLNEYGEMLIKYGLQSDA